MDINEDLMQAQECENDTQKIMIKCPKCRMKTAYINTEKFRVNYNKNKADVWLIYKCIRCNKTLNISIYSRIKLSRIPKEIYEKFMCNDEELALEYGKKITAHLGKL